jgi:hypothetical protein
MTLSSSLVGYEQDFNLWLEQTVMLLQAGRFAELDIENLVDELESMSKRDKRELLSRLTVVLHHLLKWQYQPQNRSASWRSSIQTNRREIQYILTDSPSLRGYPLTVLNKAYASARADTTTETGLTISTFPTDCPFSINAVLDEEFWPEAP